MRTDGKRALVCLSAIALICAGCVQSRGKLSRLELESRRSEFVTTQTLDWTWATRKIVRRMVEEHRLHMEIPGSSEPILDVLMLSGGGDYGAFGAGFLEGWSKLTGPMAKPDFDVVTGVSTGALIAPFAFIGDADSIEQVETLYREPKADWIQFRGPLFFLPGQASFMSIGGLERDIRSQINMDVIRKIAEKSRQGCVLAIGTTNLDLGMLKAWRLSVESERAAESGDPTRVHKILLASSAIPAAFPPVLIDDTLYVDGGTTSNILIPSDARSPRAALRLLQKRFPGAKPPKVRYWVIVNNQLGAKPQIIEPSWVSITSASVATAIRSSTIGSMRLLELQVRHMRAVDGIDAEFRFVSIPEFWRPPVEGIFQRETMRSLADLGRTMGADPESWSTVLTPEADAGLDADMESVQAGDRVP
ncbi:MAG: patatin-like phospholipase family protein [Phycisphaerales bacterium]|nr:patatin-like phospholipase family protein [Phycisphaerales bacterium]